MYIVVTLPYFFEGEAERITMMMQAGLERLHLRKPESDMEQCRQLITQIPACYHPRIVLHDHFSLVKEFAIGGVHVNGRNPLSQEDFDDLVSHSHPLTCSKSCHSLDEVRRAHESGQFDYVSLSPIFDSISKQGYKAAFSHSDLLQAGASGLFDHAVMALGGVCADNIGEVMQHGFAGVMVLGDAWQGQRLGGAQQGKNTSKGQHLPVVLSIAGSDPSAGAGIQQDLKTITNHGCYGTTVITCLTTQNTMGVQSTMPVPAEVVESQLRAVFDDLRVEAVKIGIIPNEDVAQVIVKVLREEKERRVMPIVYDPVMISTSGHQLMTDACIDYVQKELFPLCTLVTPNLPESERLSGEVGIRTPLVQVSTLVKGGHAESDEMTDVLYLVDEQREVPFSSPKIQTTNLHGTGCTLSSAIAANMALGYSLESAVRRAKQYINRAIQGGKDLHLGHGNGPLWA